MKAQPGELPENLWPVGGFESPNLSRRTSIPLNYSFMVLLLNGWQRDVSVCFGCNGACRGSGVQEDLIMVISAEGVRHG